MKTLFRWIRRLLLVLVILILCILLPVLADRAISKIRGNFLTLQEQQLEDLKRLDYLFRNEFGGYEALPGRIDFHNSLDGLKEEVSIEALAPEEFSLRVIRTVSAFRDPHTMVYNRNDLLTTVFPYYLEWVGGSFYLTSGKVNEKWLGARVLRIGNSSGQEAFDRMQVFANAPNESGKAWFIRSWMRTAHALVSQDIISDPETIALTLIQDGDTVTLNFNSMPYEEINALSDYLRLSSLSGEETWPLWKKGAGQNYRMEYLENSQTLYVRYSMCVSQGDVESFWENVFRSIEQEKPDRLVVDVRGNPGGDSKTHATFLARLSQDTLVNQYGKLFVLTDGGTGSAAVSFASDMERRTKAILVGEPTMDAPNTTSDPTFFTLPHSGITLLLPSLYSLHSYSSDPRKGIFPHIPVTASAGRESYLYDPVLDTVLAMNLYDKVPEGMHSSTLTEGCYTFSHLRNLTVANEGGTWTVAVDGLFKAPLRWSQNAWQSHTSDRFYGRKNSPGNARDTAYP